MKRLFVLAVAVAFSVSSTTAHGEGNPQRQQASCVGVFSTYDAQAGVRDETAALVKALAEAAGVAPGALVKEGATFRVDGDKVCGLPTHP